MSDNGRASAWRSALMEYASLWTEEHAKTQAALQRRKNISSFLSGSSRRSVASGGGAGTLPSARCRRDRLARAKFFTNAGS